MDAMEEEPEFEDFSEDLVKELPRRFKEDEIIEDAE